MNDEDQTSYRLTAKGKAYVAFNEALGHPGDLDYFDERIHDPIAAEAVELLVIELADRALEEACGTPDNVTEEGVAQAQRLAGETIFSLARFYLEEAQGK